MATGTIGMAGKSGKKKNHHMQNRQADEDAGKAGMFGNEADG